MKPTIIHRMKSTLNALTTVILIAFGTPVAIAQTDAKGEVVRLVISQSGDMAEEFGNFTLSFDQPDKTHISFDGSYLRVWHKIRGEWLEDAYFARPNEPEEKKKSDN